MSVGTILATLAALAAAAGLGALGWALVKRPLSVYAWTTRRGLAGAGLKPAQIQATPGPQTVFMGGTGPTVVLLHGAGDHAGTWLAAARDLVRDHRVIVPDLAGHGDSAPAEGPIPAADIYAGLEALLATLPQDQPVTLVGNSLGAWMALVLAHRLPGRVARVVAVNGGPLLGAPPKVNLLPATREEARTAMSQLRDPSNPAIPDTVLDDLVRRIKGGPMARFAATALTMGPWLLTEAQLADIRIPVRLLWGMSDQLMPPAYAERMVAALPDARLVPLERCGHVPQQEVPARFAPALRALVDETTPA